VRGGNVISGGKPESKKLPCTTTGLQYFIAVLGKARGRPPLSCLRTGNENRVTNSKNFLGLRGGIKGKGSAETKRKVCAIKDQNRILEAKISKGLEKGERGKRRENR